MIASLQYLLDNLRIEFIIGVFLVYLLILWMLVPTWVYLDAKKKFDNPNIAILFFFLVLPFNIPGLIFYVIIRPDENQNSYDDSSEDHIVNVPIVKFLNDKNDFVMSFDLKINGGIISAEHRSDLKLNLNIDPTSDSIELTQVENANNQDVETGTVSVNLDLASTRNYLQRQLDTIRGFFIDKKVDSDVVEEQNTQIQKKEKFRKKKNKKRRR